MVISTNLSAQVSAGHLQATQGRLAKSLARLSSGSQIVSPADDAAGLAVATRLGARIARLDAVAKSVANALSFLQIQDGYLAQFGKAIGRMGELALLARDETKSPADRGIYNAEFHQLGAALVVAVNKDFNGVSLFSLYTGQKQLQVPVDSEGTLFTLQSVGYNSLFGSNIATTTAAQTSLGLVKEALHQVVVARATNGAYQSRLNSVAQELTTTRQNLSSAVSRIQDVEVAEESTRFAKENILVQSGTAMLAQANQLPQVVLKLLQ